MDIQSKVQAAKRFQFLKRVVEVAGSDPRRLVPAGDLGTELGLPYEEALRIADELEREGMVERVGALTPPHGPRLRVTPGGIESVSARAA